MTNRRRAVMVSLASGAAVVLLAAPGLAAPLADAAVRFGTLEEVVSISLSPDGKYIAVVAPAEARATDLWVAATDDSVPPRTLFKNARDPNSIMGCQWASTAFLVCRAGGTVTLDGVPFTKTSLLAYSMASGEARVISRRESPFGHYFDFRGGDVVDLHGANEGSVLMTRAYVPNTRVESRVGNTKEGMGLDSVDLASGRGRNVESPAAYLAEYISDGLGTVRVRGMEVWDGPVLSSRVTYSFRKKDDKKWQPLGRWDWLNETGFQPVAVDPVADRVVGFEKIDGRQAAVAVAPDGSGARSVLLKHPQVDVDGYVLAGRKRRIVGVTYPTDYRHVEYTGPRVAEWAKALGKTMPGQAISFVDATDDESKWLVHASSDRDPGQYYLFDAATRTLRPLLENRPKLRGVPLSESRPIQYPAADGTIVPGYLTLPPGRDSVKGLPAIVLPHGGPGSRDEWGFDWLAQFYAHNGFAVLQPNFRGSAGYGENWFAKNGFQSWRLAIGDVVDGGRWLVAQGARADALNIVGWSYGGYAALQSAVVAPDLFRRVVAIAPVTDLPTMRQETARTVVSKVYRDFYGEGPHITEGSPARNAAAIKAPVLMFHGDLDQNVNIDQARIMRRALESANKQVELVEYKGYEHSLVDSAVRADMLRRTAAFLAK